MRAIYSMLAIALGAAIGANVRWLLGIVLNAYVRNLPLGTLAANLVGAFLIELMVSTLATMSELLPFWRLFIVTGFLGALTTFSTFSAGIFGELQASHFLWSFGGIAIHIGGSLGMTGLGMASFMLLRQFMGGRR